MLKSNLLFILLISVLFSTNAHYQTKFLFCLNSNIDPITIENIDGRIQTGIYELDKVISLNSITKIEQWIHGTNTNDRDGEIYLNRIYRVYLSDNNTKQLSVIMKEFSELLCVLSVERENIHYLAYTPNDEYFEQQWSLETVKTISAWDYWDINNGNTPQNPNVLLASVDTGVDWNHSDLVNSLWQNPGEDLDGDGTIVFSGSEWIFDPDDVNDIDDDGNGFVDDFIGWDCSGYDGADDNNPELPISDFNTSWTHGTMVAGLLSAETNNSNGIASISFGNNVISVKCTRDNEGNEAVINDGYAGITYASKVGYFADTTNTFTIINCSWGSNTYSSYEQSVINVAHNLYGAVIVGAAGNGDGLGNELYEPFYPASYENVISTTAVDENINWCGWGNYHETIDIAAPGVNIISTAMGDSYLTASGTSFASPIVASCFGLLKSYYPDSSNIWLENRIIETADTSMYYFDSDFEGLVGVGIVDIEKAIGNNLDINYEFQITNYELMSAFPNPFNPSTTISYAVETNGRLSLQIYNITGQLVETLVNEQVEAGYHQVTWNAENQPSGLYFVRMAAGDYISTQKMLLLK